MRGIIIVLPALLVGCGEPATQPTPEPPYEIASPKPAEQKAVNAAVQAEIDERNDRERRIEEVRRRDPAVNWVNIGITTGKFSESIGTSVHKTYEECINRSAMEDNECFPIPALPDSYWNAEPAATD